MSHSDTAGAERARTVSSTGPATAPNTPVMPRATDDVRHRRLARALAWWALGALALGTVLAPRDDAPGAFGAPVGTPMAALPADLHRALHEPVAVDVTPPPAAQAGGFRVLAEYRFPDLQTEGVHPARSLTRLTLAGFTAATLYRGADGCDFTLAVAPTSLAAMLMFTGERPAHVREPPGARRHVALVTGFDPAIRLRVWSARDTVWVASSDTVGPERFAALADLAARRTDATSAPANVVHVARGDGVAEGLSCGTG